MTSSPIQNFNLIKELPYQVTCTDPIYKRVRDNTLSALHRSRLKRLKHEEAVLLDFIKLWLRRLRKGLGKLTLVFVLLIMMLTYVVLNIIITIETYLKEIYQTLRR